MASEDTSPAVTQERDVENLPLIGVRIPHSLDTQGQAADYGGWTRYALAGTEQPQPILPFDSYRHRATISVSLPSQVTSQTDIAGTSPAAGSNYTYTNTSGQAQQLLAAVATLTTDATVANRFAKVEIADAAGNILFIVQDQSATTASETLNVNAFQGATQQNSGVGTAMLPLPLNMMVPAGGQVLLSGVAGGSADQWSAIRLTFSQTATPFIYLGTQAQCLQGVAGRLYGGQQVIIENNQQLWMAPDGADSVIVSVLAERWDSGT